MDKKEKSAASLRWGILRRALLSPPTPPPPLPPLQPSASGHPYDGTKIISRKTIGGFNLVSCHPIDEQFSEEFCKSLRSTNFSGPSDVYVCYKLPIARTPKVILVQRKEDCIDLDDFVVSSRYDIDTTGLVCCWPSEDVLAYFCMTHSHIFRSKRILELGSGYGLTGLAIAASTGASEVVISDGNPQVVDYIQLNIHINAEVFGSSKVNSMLLHWDQDQATEILNTFDIIVASDCQL